MRVYGSGNSILIDPITSADMVVDLPLIPYDSREIEVIYASAVTLTLLSWVTLQVKSPINKQINKPHHI